ncbi:MAG: DUF4255 domain-containing protein [Gemmatimonadaceae bacterium]
MSNSQIIAATTATIRVLLLNGIPARDAAMAQVDVSTNAPDKVVTNIERPTINLFLFQVVPNAAFRNRDAVHARLGESTLPPLALNLHYMLTAYGPVDVDEGDFSHRVLGSAVSVLHDHPLLSNEELSDALPSHKALPQVERMRIAPLATSVEEMSKLWTMFQTNYRLSIAYEVSVALIESDRPAVRPLPVLRRGANDRGPAVIASAIPTLVMAVPPNGQLSLRLGEVLKIEGRNFGAGVRARVSGTRLASPRVFSVLPGGDSENVSIALPAAADAGVMAAWAPGFYTIAAVLQHEGMHDLSSNAVAFAIAPSVTVAPNSAPAGTVTLTVLCTPRLRDDQVAVLLVGNPSRTIVEDPRAAVADTSKPTQCVFQVTGVAGDRYAVRLRVDGVDSIPIDPAAPTQFDPAQMVQFT